MLRYSTALGVGALTIAWGALVSGELASADDSRPVFVSKIVPIEFTFPTGWHLNPEKNPFDLQVLSPTEEMNTSVFVYKKSEFDNPSTLAIFKDQIEKMKEIRKNFVEKYGMETLRLQDKTITTITYTGENESKRHWYHFALIEFSPSDDGFAVAMQIAVDGNFDEIRPYFSAIARTARLLPASK